MIHFFLDFFSPSFQILDANGQCAKYCGAGQSERDGCKSHKCEGSCHSMLKELALGNVLLLATS